MEDVEAVFAPEEGEARDNFANSGVIEVGKKSYAYGLHWSVATEDVSGRRFLPYVRQAAADEGADLICIEGQSAFGLASKEAGHTRGMRPLATSLAYNLTDPFLAAFAIEGHGYYVLASRDGHILPGCERMFAEEEEARSFFSEMMTRANWSQLVAPESFALSGTEARELTELVTSSRSRVRLMDATRRTMVVRTVACALAVVLVAAGYFAYTTWKQIRMNELHNIQLAKANADIARQRAKHAAEIAAQTWPYDGKPKGAFAIAACQEDMLGLEYRVPGWTAKKLTCEPESGKVTVLYEKTYGTINWLAPFLEKNAHGIDVKVGSSKDERSASAVWSFHNFTHVYGHHEPSLNNADEWKFLKTNFAELGMNPKLEIVTPAPAKTTRKSSKSQSEVTVFSHMNIEWSSGYPPMEFLRLFAPLQAFVVNSVSVDLVKGAWTVNANTYQKIIEQSNANRSYNQMIPFNKNAKP
ncbi:hypothetical protein AD929_04345 [Gluconobacter potus]|uniref:Pilin accessory protein (PilO) n=1 Tax=Gluconobacter potus TaxID=2724927 RepID=A0A149QXK4_9PROT|nr:type 4b pilus protein PilO2 [Gluconobacter potus]KXV02039.1 hypothetical protein AD929_04345 [Gluconobacter potus]